MPQCSIYESGVASYEGLKLSKEFEVSYFPTSSKTIGWLEKASDVDLLIINYHPATFPIPGVYLQDLNTPTMALCFETNPSWESPWDVPSSMGEELRDIFDFIATPDPERANIDERVCILPRIVLRSPETDRPISMNNPIVSTFGLPGKSKDLVGMIRAVSDEFETAHIRYHFPLADWGGAEQALYGTRLDEYETMFRETAHEGIKFSFTRDFKERGELIAWLSESDLNIFLYHSSRDLFDLEGNIPSATDHAISARRPLAVNSLKCTSHIGRYTPHYPEASLVDIMKLGTGPTQAMYDAWSPEKFAGAFDTFLKDKFK